MDDEGKISSLQGTSVDEDNETANVSVPAVERALDILELLAEGHARDKRLTQAQIGRHLGLPKGTAHRLLATLKTRGYIERIGGESGRERGGYTLGARLITLAAQARGQMDVVQAAESPMRQLARETGEGCQLSVRVQGQAVCVARVPSPSHPEVTLMGGIGSSFPLHAVAVGKALLAGASENEQEAYAEQYMVAFTPRTLTTRNSLLAELTRIRETGLACDEQEYKRGLRALAAPVFDAAGAVCAALALPLLVGDETDLAAETSFETALREAAAVISHELGYRKAQK